jgi:hypothetical protein
MAAKKGLKVYKTDRSDIPYNVLKAARHEGALYPLYGDIRSLNDIHHLGESVEISPGKKEKTGFAYAALPIDAEDGLTPLQQREEFEDLVTSLIGYTDTDRQLVEILADKIIEDEPDYPKSITEETYEQDKRRILNEYLMVNPDLVHEYMDGDPEELDVNPGERFAIAKDNLINEIAANPVEWDLEHLFEDQDIINGYDTQRDSPAEHRAQQITPQQIIPLLNPLTPEKAQEIADEMNDLTKGNVFYKPTKKDLLRIGRKHGMSPYALKHLATQLTYAGGLTGYDVPSLLREGSFNDTVRKVLEDIFKHEKEYDSDMRLKNIIPSVNRRFS